MSGYSLTAAFVSGDASNGANAVNRPKVHMELVMKNCCYAGIFIVYSMAVEFAPMLHSYPEFPVLHVNVDRPVTYK